MLLRDRDVLDRAFNGEQIRQHFAPGEGREGERTDELLRRGGHHHLNMVALLHQEACQFRGLVCCDSAADPEENLHTG